MVAVHPDTQMVWSMLSWVTAGLATPEVLVLSGKSRANAEVASRARASSSQRFLTMWFLPPMTFGRILDLARIKVNGRLTPTGAIGSVLLVDERWPDLDPRGINRYRLRCPRSRWGFAMGGRIGIRTLWCSSAAGPAAGELRTKVAVLAGAVEPP